MAQPALPIIQAASGRRFLLRLTAASAALAAGAAAWPLLASLAPAADTLARDETVLDLAGLSPGGSRIGLWRHIPVMAIHRSPAELEALRRLGPAPGETDMPWQIGTLPQWRIRTWHRALRAELGVFLPFCTHDLVRLPPPERDGERAGHFCCPWCISRYDLAGRPRYGPARFALAVPPYRAPGPGRIVLGRTAPADA